MQPERQLTHIYHMPRYKKQKHNLSDETLKTLEEKKQAIREGGSAEEIEELTKAFRKGVREDRKRATLEKVSKQTDEKGSVARYSGT